MTKAQTPNLTPEQLTALRHFANSRGRTWKAALGNAWMTGAYGFADNAPALQQIRNTFGPSWLGKFRFPVGA